MSVKVVDFAIDLTSAGKSPLVFIDTEDYDSCSIQTYNPEGATFNSGVITVKKSNVQAGGVPIDINPTPVTITQPGIKELVAADWEKCRYLVLQATTAASSATRILGTACLKKLGRELAETTYATGGLFSYQHVNGLSGISTYQVAGLANATALTAAAVTANRLYAVPFVAPTHGGVIDQLALNVTTLAAGNTRVGIYDNVSPMNLCPGLLIVDGGAVSTGTTGVKTFSVNVNLTAGKLYWMACVFDAAPSVRTISVSGMWAILGLTALGTAPNVGVYYSFTYAPLPSVYSTTPTAMTAAAPALAYRLFA